MISLYIIQTLPTVHTLRADAPVTILVKCCRSTYQLRRHARTLCHASRLYICTLLKHTRKKIRCTAATTRDVFAEYV